MVGILSVASSYRENVERPRDAVPDTVQFWFGPNGNWRVKTFALDHDIHVYRLGGELTPAAAIANTAKHYGEVLAGQVQLAFADTSVTPDVERTLRAAGLAGSLEVASHGFAF